MGRHEIPTHYRTFTLMKSDTSILIVGGGLSGLYLAHLLDRAGIKATILEGANRLGGRILTVSGELGTPMELGATWFSDLHTELIGLLDTLGVEKYPQYTLGKSIFQTKSFEPAQIFEVPEAQEPSYRIAGGTQSLISALAQSIDSENIILETAVTGIQDHGDRVLIKTETDKTYTASKVVFCIPPELIASSIKWEPELPFDLKQLLPTVHTWMAGSIKFVVEYGTPFWRDNGFSGMLFSHSGIVTEMYDHANWEENRFGFTGFLNSGAASYSQETRRELILSQLSTLLGAEAANAITYQDRVWNTPLLTQGNQIIHRPHQNNGHPLLQPGYLNGKVYFSATETASDFAGYMEGALRAATRTYHKLNSASNV